MLTTYKRGFIWGVGTGDKINIYNDLWIRSSADRKIISQRGNIIFEKVSQLMDPISGT
jgi:hypothetical protein